jgi:hypothetical protein
MKRIGAISFVPMAKRVGPNTRKALLPIDSIGTKAQ